MRIVFDLQPCQTPSRLRGVGRYTIGIAQAMILLEVEHEYWMFLSDRFPETISSILESFAGLVPPERIVIASMPKGTEGNDAANVHRTRAAELVREYTLARINPDFVFICNLFEGFADSFVASIGHQKIKTAVVLHDLIPLALPEMHVTEPAERGRYEVLLNYLKRADLILAVSEYSRKDALQYLGSDLPEIVTISAAIEPRFRKLDIDQETASRTKAQYGIDREFIMFTGALEERKNLERLLEAYRLLGRELRQHFQLLIVGPTLPKVVNHIRMICARLKLRDQEVLISGHLPDDDLIRLYNLCTVFVLPSIYEGFGLPALEAMACGAAVIGSNATSLPEVIGRADALFDPFQSASIAAVLERVLTDVPFREDLRKSGLRRSQEFSWAKVARRALNAMERRLAEGDTGHRQTDEHARDATYEALMSSFNEFSVFSAAAQSDLIDWAACIVRNAEFPRPRQIFIDLTELYFSRYTLVCQSWSEIIAIIKNIEEDICCVYYDGLLYRSLKIEALQDLNVGRRTSFNQEIDPQPGDVLLAIPSLSLPPESLEDATRVLRQRGTGVILCNSATVGSADLPKMVVAPLLAGVVTRMKGSGFSNDGGILWQEALAGLGFSTIDAGEHPAGLATGASVNGHPCNQILRIALGDSYLGVKEPALFPSRKSHFTVAGHMSGSYSLAIINRNIARALANATPGAVRIFPVEGVARQSLDSIPEHDPLFFENLRHAVARHGQRRVAISQHYPIYVPEGDFDLKLALVVWEESLIPSSTIELLETAFDAVVAGTHFVARALVNSGLSIPIITCGQPVCLEGHLLADPARQAAGGASTFLHISSCFPRKGVDLLLEAWGRAFTINDDVKLVIKTFPNPHNDCAEQIAALSRSYPRHAPIELINKELAQDSLLALYRRSDAIVLPTRGEGYNLPALEAMAAGLPLIVTGNSGHLDFCTTETARLLRYKFAYSESHVASDQSLWLEPDLDDLVDALRELRDPEWYNIVEARVAQGRVAAGIFARPDLWAKNFLSAVEKLPMPARSSLPKIGWISTFRVPCGIAEYSAYLLESLLPEIRNQVVVFCDDRTPTGYDAHGIKLVPSWKFRGEGIWDNSRLVRAISREEPDIIVIQHQDGLIGWWDIVPLLESHNLACRPTVVVLHNAVHLCEIDDEQRGRVLAALTRCTRVLVHTIEDLNMFVEWGLRDNLVLFPHGITPPDHRSPPIQAMHGVARAPLLGAHGFFLPGKGIPALIRAAAQLRQIWPELRLRLVTARFPDPCSDQEIAESVALADALGMAANIDWYTEYLPREQIAELLGDCDLLILPYDQRTDSASGAVRVAMASQVPVLVSDVGIFRELSDAVARMPGNTPSIIVDAIRDLLLNPEKRVALQERSRVWMAARNWPVLGARLVGMLHGLVVEARARDRL